VIVTTTTVPGSAGTTPPPADATTGAPTSSPTAGSEPGTPTTGTVPPTPTAPAPMGDPVVAFEQVGSFDQPLDVSWRSGDPRLFVVEQSGRVVALDPATGATQDVLDVSDRTAASGERGLLGLAFSPDGTLAYVNHTDLAGDTQIIEVPVAADGTMDAGAARTVLSVDQPYANHNGGNLEFGPDGLLYIGMGDGGSGGDPQRYALDATSLLGKLLRIDPRPSGDQPYTVPPDNPYVGVDGARPELWSIGLRNPWKFSFDPLTQDLWVTDVGQNAFEEVNVVPSSADGTTAGRGTSFGWSAYEGTERFNIDQPADGHVAPVLTYAHGDDGCSISGGEPYRGTAIPALSSGFVYGDYCSGRVWALDLAGSRNVLLGTPGSVSAVADGPDGELYVVSSDGPVWRITPR
jgi:glucose/arabinose dehydrogenase